MNTEIPLIVGGGAELLVDTFDPGNSKLRCRMDGVAFDLAKTCVLQGTADARVLSDGGITSSSKAFSSASAGFRKSDEGKVVLIAGAAAGPTDLATTIATFVSPTQVTLTVAAGVTVSNATWAFGTNNTAALTAGLAAINGTGKTLVVPPGQYIFGSPADWSTYSNLTLSGYGATFIAAMPGTLNSLFGGGSLVGPDLALSADVSNNQRTFQLSTGAPLSVGQTITLNAGELGSTYTVTAVAGSSPQTVTVDREILFIYKLSAGARVNVVTSLVTKIGIQGLTFTGSCTNYVKIRGVTNSFIRDCSFLDTIGSASNTPLFLSLFSFNWHVDNVYVHQPADSGMASCEQCWVTRYTSIGAGFQILNSANVGLQNFSISKAVGSGITIDQLASAAGVPYTVGVTVADGLIGGCAVSGITENGFYTLIDNVLIVGNVGSGIVLGSASEGPKVSRCRIVKNGSTGINNSAGIVTGTPATVVDCYIADNTKEPTSSASCIVTVGASLYILGCQLVPDRSLSFAGFSVQSSDQGFTFGCTCIIDNCDILVPGGLGAAFVQQTNNPLSIITNTRIRFSGGAGVATSGLNNLNGRMIVDNIQCVQLSGTTGTTGLGASAGSLTRIGPNCDFDGCSTPVSIAGFCNRSINGSANANSVTLNGTTPVNYGFTATKSTDRVQLILRTRGATPGNGAVLVAITAGTGISLAGNAAGVNDVYDVVIG